MSSRKLRFAVFGAGFWSRFQLAAWGEIPDVVCVALHDPRDERAREVASAYQIPKVYSDPAELLKREKPDFVDIISNAASHVRLAELAVAHGVPVICQKPLAPSLAEAEELVRECHAAGVPLLVHENWRWQRQIRALAAALHTAPIGRPWRAHINYWSSFPFHEFQPALKDLRPFILVDMGTHILDTMRFLFGEAESVYARGHSITPGIRGEDAISALFQMRNGMTVYVNLSYASRVPGERFPETYITVEGQDASVALQADYRVAVTTKTRSEITRHPPQFHSWADPRFGPVHSSIVATHRNLLLGLRGECPAETTGEDNLATLRLVFGSIESIESGQIVRF